MYVCVIIICVVCFIQHENRCEIVFWINVLMNTKFSTKLNLASILHVNYVKSTGCDELLQVEG
jgi:hypothetical protein